jgi:hypothetical protein
VHAAGVAGLECSHTFNREAVILYSKLKLTTTKMADVLFERVSPSTNLASNSGSIVENTCQCCDILKSELHKAKLDIISYEEIINILLEEQFSSKLKQRKTNGHLSEEEYFFPTSREDTAKVSSGIGSNISNLIQIIPTVNKYEVLANLNDASEATCNTSVSVEKNISSKISKKKGQKMNQKKIQNQIT